MHESKNHISDVGLDPRTLLRRLNDAPDSPLALSGGQVVRILIRAGENDPGGLTGLLSDIQAGLRRRIGLQETLNVLRRVEVALGYRRPAIGIYDNAFHFIGGAQKYGCTLAAALQEDCDVTLIANSDIEIERLMSWYDLDLTRCRMKTVRIPFFGQRGADKEVFDAGRVDKRGDNPFHVISLESGAYDIFVNNCMLEMVYPLSPISEFVCHFPEREKSRFFHVAKYTHIIHNSLYTAEWIQKRWNLTPHVHIYPPVDMESGASPEAKEKLILSVSRFELSGNKQQLEMLKSFARLLEDHPEDMREWRLVLAGGSTSANPYLEKIRRVAAALPRDRVEILVNLPADRLKDIYRRARIFWHFSGLQQSDPARVEHFGMTTAEAMQNAVVPLVFNGGGQKEIVDDDVSGLFFRDERELAAATLRLVRDPELTVRLAKGAIAKGQIYSKRVFTKRVKDHFARVLAEYRCQRKVS